MRFLGCAVIKYGATVIHVRRKTAIVELAYCESSILKLIVVVFPTKST